MQLNVLSYGGGVQSTAILVLAKENLVKVDAAIFVELDTENPDTVRYVRDFAEPFAKDLGIRFVRIFFSLTRMIEDNPSFPAVPFKDMHGRVFGKRQCTSKAKIRPFRSALRVLMRDFGAKRANVIFGISADEAWRMRDSDVRYIENVYPLVNFNLSRDKCKDIIAAHLPIPPKSSCWFCPFMHPSQQRHIIEHNPHLLKDAIRLERLINSARGEKGLDKLSILNFDENQMSMFDDVCGGTCHT